MPLDLRPQFFDHSSPFAVIERGLPHWCQSGTISFITWRTWDSMPTAWIDQWLADRADWLRANGIDPDEPDWRRSLGGLPEPARAEFNRTFARRWETCLDECHGSCPLKRPELAAVVADSLRHFDGDRYALTEFVVMPNHVHLLAAFPNEGAMLAQCESWKRFTATRLNRLLGRFGRFWQVDGFDHLVRDESHFAKFRRYIADNPKHARLREGEYLWFSKTQHEPKSVALGESDPP